MIEYLALAGFILLCLTMAGGSNRLSSGEGLAFVAGTSPIHCLILTGVFCATIFHAGLFGGVFPVWLHHLALNRWHEIGPVGFAQAWRSIGSMHWMAMMIGLPCSLYIAWRHTTLCAIAWLTAQGLQIL